MMNKKRGFTLIELLVVVLILAVLTAIAIPLYLKSVSDAGDNSCKTNMASIAEAVQANRVKTGGAYWTGPVDATAAANGGPLEDLHNAVPVCPEDPADGYVVSSDGSGGFIVRCTNPQHRFEWHNGGYETY